MKRKLKRDETAIWMAIPDGSSIGPWFKERKEAASYAAQVRRSGTRCRVCQQIEGSGFAKQAACQTARKIQR